MVKVLIKASRAGDSREIGQPSFREGLGEAGGVFSHIALEHVTHLKLAPVTRSLQALIEQQQGEGNHGDVKCRSDQPEAPEHWRSLVKG